MNLYAIVLFLHVLGAIVAGAGMLTTLVGMWALRRAQRVEQVRTILGMIRLIAPLSGIGMLVLVAAGLYMTAANWGWQIPWINVAIIGLVLLVVAGAIMGTRRSAIAKQIGEMPDGPLSASLVESIHDPVFGTSANMLVALMVGIVFLMVAKPALDGSIIAIVIAAAIGAAASVPLRRSATGEAAELRQHREGQG